MASTSAVTVHTPSPTQLGSMLLALVLATGCNRSLDSIEGPSEGIVLGLACVDLSTLSAITEAPQIQASLVSAGTCMHLQGSRVKVVKTVLMPNSGKFSQFEVTTQGRTLRLWIDTAKLV